MHVAIERTAGTVESWWFYGGGPVVEIEASEADARRYIEESSPLLRGWTAHWDGLTHARVNSRGREVYRTTLHRGPFRTPEQRAEANARAAAMRAQLGWTR